MYSRVNVVRDEDLIDCFTKWRTREESLNSWKVKREEVDDEEFDLTANNPNVILGFKTQDPKKLVTQIIEKERRIPVYLEEIDRILFDGNRDNMIFENWSYLRIGKLLENGGLQSGFACSKKHLVKAGVPHLRPFNVGMDGKLDLSEIAYLPETMVDTGLYSLKKGDVIFNNTNSKELVGKSALVEQDLKCGFSNHLTRLRVKSATVRPDWLLLTLRLHWLSGLFLKKSRKWIGQAGVNPSAILKIEIPVPPIRIQQKIIDDLQKSTQYVEDIRQLRNEIEDDMKVLRPSIFKYFILNQS